MQCKLNLRIVAATLWRRTALLDHRRQDLLHWKVDGHSSLLTRSTRLFEKRSLENLRQSVRILSHPLLAACELQARAPLIVCGE